MNDILVFNNKKVFVTKLIGIDFTKADVDFALFIARNEMRMKGNITIINVTEAVKQLKK